MPHWIQAPPAPGDLSSQSQLESSGCGLSAWLSARMFERCSGKQEEFAVFTTVKATEFLRS